ncbi:MAG: carboxypeptidase-like regulatory domain-containing protein [Planctomycetes bacterium]|nr:carboxypeptidase-like regulatory domain-containing protein [Planctomycetota bacterium]
MRPIATLGSSGEFRFEGLQPAIYVIVASLEPHFVDELRQIDLETRGSAEDVLLTLPDARHITVTVVDAQGVGVPRAKVTIHSGKEEHEHLTDGAGIARETVLGDEMVVMVLPPTDVSRSFLVPRNVGIRPPQESARVVLEDAGLASGVVWLAQTDRPLSGATVVTLLGDREVSRATAGADGSFQALMPCSGPATLRVDALELLFNREVRNGEFPEGRLDGVRAGDQDLRLVVRLHTVDQRLRVVVQDPDGRGIPNATVVLRPEGRISQLAFDTNEAGVAEISHLPDCELEVVIVRPVGLEGADEWVWPVIPRVRANGQEIDFRFSKGLRLNGTVVGPGGEPCGWAHLESRQTQPKRVDADAEGHFSVLVDENVDSSIDFRAWTGSGHAKLTANLAGVNPRGGEIVIRLQREK